MKLALACIFCFLTYGCGMQELAVDNADRLLSYQITRRLPLTSKQTDLLKKDIKRFLIQEKSVAQELLPVIDQIDLTGPDKLAASYQKLQEFYARIASDFSELIATHMAPLDRKQREEMFETLEDENRKLLKKGKEERLEDIEESFIRLLGPLSGPQKKIVRSYEDYYHARAQQRVERRAKLQQEIKEIFKVDRSDKRKTQLSQAFGSFQKVALEGNKTLEIIQKIAPTLSKKQREHFRTQVSTVKEILKYYLTVDY